MNRTRTAGAGALLLAAAVALTGCSATTTSTASRPQTAPGTASTNASPSASEFGPSAATPATVPAGSHLSPAEFASAAGATGTVLLDVRTPAEFAAGHLPGAVNVDVESPDFAAVMAERDESATYAVYCHSGRRSGLALQQLGKLGFAEAYDLAGGIAAWTAAGRQVVSGP